MGKKSKKGTRIYDGNIVLVTYFRLLVVLLFFFLSRIFFYLFNLHYFSVLGFSELMRLFLIGCRFDISAILIINLPVIFFFCIPFKFRYNKVYKGVVNFYFYLVNSIAIMANFVDLIYFRFTLKRMTAEIFSYLSVGGDFSKLVPQFLHDFWYVAVVWLILILLFIYAVSRFSASPPPGKSKGNLTSLILNSLLFLFILGLCVLGIRGGTQLRPISIITAGNYTNARYIPLVLNTPFTIVRTIGPVS